VIIDKCSLSKNFT